MSFAYKCISLRSACFIGTVAMYLFVGAPLASSEDAANRYDERAVFGQPIESMPITVRPSGPVSIDDVKPAEERVRSDRRPKPKMSGKKRAKKTVQQDLVLRHVEGIDAVPSAFLLGTAKSELGDPFGRALLERADNLPFNIRQVLDLLDTVSGERRLPNQATFIVSETGQISVQEAPQLKRSERAVIARTGPDGRDIVFVLPAMRADGILEIMGWDARKKAFNFYERKIDDSSGRVRWIWKGDSSHAWEPRTRDGFCFGCHRNGEPVMKELRAPWQNWHSQSASIRDESITQDSPLRRDPLFSVLEENASLRKGEDFENLVRSWIGRTNETRISRFKAGKLTYKRLVAPLFRTTTVNLQSSHDVSEGAQSPVRAPWTFFYNVRGLEDGVQLVCEGATAFGQTVPEVPRQRYTELLSELDFSLQQGSAAVEFIKKPGDTHFAFMAPEPSEVDVDLISHLVSEGIVSRRFAATVLLVDVSNPVYSTLREALHAAAPDKLLEPRANAAKLEAGFVAQLRKLRGDKAQPAAMKAALAEFFEIWNAAGEAWEAKGCSRLESYLSNVGKRWKSGRFAPYFKLLGARREAFRSSDHKKLEESQLLFPKSAGSPGLVMHYDGSVGPR